MVLNIERKKCLFLNVAHNVHSQRKSEKERERIHRESEREKREREREREKWIETMTNRMRFR